MEDSNPGQLDCSVAKKSLVTQSYFRGPDVDLTKPLPNSILIGIPRNSLREVNTYWIWNQTYLPAKVEVHCGEVCPVTMDRGLWSLELFLCGTLQSALHQQEQFKKKERPLALITASPVTFINKYRLKEKNASPHDKCCRMTNDATVKL